MVERWKEYFEGLLHGNKCKDPESGKIDGG